MLTKFFSFTRRKKACVGLNCNLFLQINTRIKINNWLRNYATKLNDTKSRKMELRQRRFFKNVFATLYSNFNFFSFSYRSQGTRVHVWEFRRLNHWQGHTSVVLSNWPGQTQQRVELNSNLKTLNVSCAECNN